MVKWKLLAMIGILMVALFGSKVPAENKVKWGGRIMFDWAEMSGDPGYDPFLNDGSEFRQLRVSASGDLGEWISFKAEVDFAAGGDVLEEEVQKKDVYLQFNKIPVLGIVRVGHFKEPFSLEELTSSKYITFMERSLINAFAPARNNGLFLQNTHFDKRLYWGFGVFQDTDDSGSSVKGPLDPGTNANFTARISGLPWARDDRHLFHLGLGASYRQPDAGAVLFRTRPEAHLAGRPISTGVISAIGSGEVDDYLMTNLEAAVVLGRFSAQGEYLKADLDDGLTDPSFDGFYVQGSYWISRGDYRPYRRDYGIFDRPKPHNPFDPKNGTCGGWEVALRYSTLDLSDTPNPQTPPGVALPALPQIGGEISDITLGVNWHLNNYTRLMFNYVTSEIEDGSMGITNDAGIYMARLQVDW